MMPCVLPPLVAHRSLDLRLDDLGPMDSLPTPSIERTKKAFATQNITEDGKEDDDLGLCIYEDRKTLRGMINDIT